uniref:Reverse transcriptase domain-containing protein n=1 Tax=Tanacetum cinerariifolium TaxID=118510 RepID=A0A699H961_TANCI|nr:reverse transcriptase domain-containing protein [Tanacetum cinerariifolium]
MCTNEQTPLSQPTLVVKNTLGKEQVSQNLGGSISDEAVREYCDKNYHQILPIIAKKEHQAEGGISKKGLDPGMLAAGPEVLNQGSETRKRVCPHTREIQSIGHPTVAARTLKVTTRALAPQEQSSLLRNIIIKERAHEIQDDLSQPWVCEETDPFTPRIRYFDFSKTRMPNHIKTYDGSKDLEDHLKIFQAATKTERWAMPTWFHMFNSTLTENARKKCIKDRVEIHNIKQRDGETTEEFVRRYKIECRDVKGAPKCMKIFGFMHGITNPELIKRLHDNILKSVDEMMRVTTTFLRGEVAASIVNERSCFHHENNKKSDKSKTSRREAFETSRERSGGKTDSPFSQKHQRKFWFWIKGSLNLLRQ